MFAGENKSAKLPFPVLQNCQLLSCGDIPYCGGCWFGSANRCQHLAVRGKEDAKTAILDVETQLLLAGRHIPDNDLGITSRRGQEACVRRENGANRRRLLRNLGEPWTATCQEKARHRCKPRQHKDISIGASPYWRITVFPFSCCKPPSIPYNRLPVCGRPGIFFFCVSSVTLFRPYLSGPHERQGLGPGRLSSHPAPDGRAHELQPAPSQAVWRIRSRSGGPGASAGKPPSVPGGNQCGADRVAADHPAEHSDRAGPQAHGQETRRATGAVHPRRGRPVVHLDGAPAA